MPSIEPTWDLARELLARTARNQAWASAGEWTIDVLERDLGPNWLASAAADADPGHLVLRPELFGIHVVAFSEALELALWLDLLADVPGMGRIRKDLRSDPRPERLLHSRLQLQLVGQAARLGWSVALEPKTKAGLTPPDAELAWNGGTAAIEAKVLTESALAQDARQAGTEAMDHIRDLVLQHLVWIGGVIAEPPDQAALAEIEEWVGVRAPEVRANPQATSRLEGAWGQLELVNLDSPHKASLTGPVVGEDLWPRFIRTAADKVEQMRGSGARWLWLQPLTGLWRTTPWGLGTPELRIETLAAALQQALAPGGLDGLVVCSTAGLAAGELGAVEKPVVIGAGGSKGGGMSVRLSVAPHRCRETVVVPLSDEGWHLLDGFQELIKAEASWLDWALEQRGLPGLGEIFATA